MSEDWKTIPGYSDLYRASDLGRVHVDERMRRDGRWLPAKFLTIGKGEGGYLYTTVKNIEGKGKMVGVHRLVALAFIPNPLGLSTVNHKDGNTANNLLDNLEWMTVKENVLHGVHVLGHGHGETSARAYITRDQAKSILDRLRAGERQSDLVRELKISSSIISNIFLGKHWTSDGFKCASQLPPKKFTKDTNRASIDGEVWKVVAGYEGMYEVSDHGRVWACDRAALGLSRHHPPHLLKVMVDDRYLLVNLCRDKKQRCVRVANIMRDAGFSLEYFPAGFR